MATCESDGHIYGGNAACIFCGSARQENPPHGPVSERFMRQHYGASRGAGGLVSHEAKPVPSAPLRQRAEDHWAVSVFRNGENVVTIESNCLSGRDLSTEDVEIIRNCAKHLLAFIGDNELAAVREEATRAERERCEALVQPMRYGADLLKAIRGEAIAAADPGEGTRHE